MKFLIISGLSGAGKSRAAGVLEDLDFYCVDNMPIELIPRFAEFCMATRGRYERVALVTDIRAGTNFDELFSAVGKMKDMGFDHEILFIEASVEAIINRYKETRRRHPLEDEGSIRAAVEREIGMLAPLRAKADYVIDTTDFSLSRLQRELHKLFANETDKVPMVVNITSFGFKYGLPMEADMVFDARFLPNPFYVKSLKNLTGLDEPVRAYIFGYEQARDFLDKITDMIDFLLPLYVEEGRHSLTISIGCTGGRHRSVAVADALADFVEGKGYMVNRDDRDIANSREVV